MAAPGDTGELMYALGDPMRGRIDDKGLGMIPEVALRAKRGTILL